MQSTTKAHQSTKAPPPRLANLAKPLSGKDFPLDKKKDSALMPCPPVVSDLCALRAA